MCVLALILSLIRDSISTMKLGRAFAILGVLALLSSAVSARQLKQDSSSITDADVLNFALNLEVRHMLYTCLLSCHGVSLSFIRLFAR